MKEPLRLDPRLRALYLVGVAVGVFFLPGWPLAVAAALQIALWLALGLGPRPLARQLRKLALLLALIAAAYALVSDDPSTDRWTEIHLLGLSLDINTTGALTGLAMVLRLVTVVLASHIARAGDPRSLASGLRRLGLPASAALTLDAVLALLADSAPHPRRGGGGGGGGGGRGGGRGGGGGGRARASRDDRETSGAHAPTRVADDSPAAVGAGQRTPPSTEIDPSHAVEAPARRDEPRPLADPRPLDDADLAPTLRDRLVRFRAALLRLARGDVGALVDRLDHHVSRAERHIRAAAPHPGAAHLARDVAVVAGLALTMLGIKALKLLPGLPFAPGHKGVLLIPLYIAAGLMTRSRAGSTLTGLTMGTVAFLLGDGRYGIFEIAKHVSPGVLVDLLLPLMRPRDTRRGVPAWALFGLLVALGRFATVTLIALAVQAPAVVYALLLPGLLVHATFGLLSGLVTAPLLRALSDRAPPRSSSAGPPPPPPAPP